METPLPSADERGMGTMKVDSGIPSAGIEEIKKAATELEGGPYAAYMRRMEALGVEFFSPPPGTLPPH